jgi:catechol 2,3-dioxygenase-like lactoylglutathione lyase family enzyme
MMQKIATVSLVVRDYDEAIGYYTQKLGFRLVEDRKLSDTKRWVTVAPGPAGTRLLLAKAASTEQATRVGDQTGGRVFIVLETDDFQRDYQAMRSRGVTFLEEPREEAYGIVAVFQDLYGNKWDLLEPWPRAE